MTKESSTYRPLRFLAGFLSLLAVAFLATLYGFLLPIDWLVVRAQRWLLAALFACVHFITVFLGFHPVPTDAGDTDGTVS